MGEGGLEENRDGFHLTHCMRLQGHHLQWVLLTQQPYPQPPTQVSPSPLWPFPGPPMLYNEFPNLFFHLVTSWSSPSFSFHWISPLTFSRGSPSFSFHWTFTFTISMGSPSSLGDLWTLLSILKILLAWLKQHFLKIWFENWSGDEQHWCIYIMTPHWIRC